MTVLMTGDLVDGGSTRNSHADSPLALVVRISHDPEISGALGDPAGSAGLATRLSVNGVGGQS